MQKTDNNKPPSALSSKQTSLVSLQDNELTKYLKYFLTIEGYKQIEQGKDLLKLLSSQKNDKVLEKTMKTLCYFLEHATAEGKVCGLQFLKEAMDLAKSKVFAVIEKNAIGVLIDAVQYRNHVKSMVRGSTYFMNKIDKNEKESKVVQLVRLSNTYFRMSHQMLYVWGVKYFPNSHFGIVYKKLSKYCTFPQFPNQFKFYRAAKIQQMEKKKEILQINKLLKDRNVSDIPALSSRSNRSRKSKSKQNDEENVGKQISNTHMQKQKEENNAELDEIEQDIFESQRSNQSKVFIKSSKLALKPKRMEQKIPKNVIYRQSSIEDPEDVTNSISVGNYQLNQKQKNHLEIPLGIIPEINTQEGSSKQQSRNNSMRSKSKNEKQQAVGNGGNILQKNSIKEQKDELEEQNEASEKRGYFNQSDDENKSEKVQFSPKENTDNKNTNPQLKDEMLQQRQGMIDKNELVGKVEVNGMQKMRIKGEKKTKQTKIGSNNTKIEQREYRNTFTSNNKTQQIDLRSHEINRTKNSIKVESIELKHEQNNWFNDSPKTKISVKQDQKVENELQKHVRNATKSDKQLKNQTNQEISVNLKVENNQRVGDLTVIKQKRLQDSAEDIRKANRGEKSYEKILPIQSDIESSSQLQKTNQQKGSKRMSRHSSHVKKIKKKIDLDDNNDDFDKNTVNKKEKEQNKQIKENSEVKIKYKRPLSFNQVYQIKQLSLVSRIEQQDLKQKVENQRKLNSVRKFKRFRQVALTLVPGQSHKQQKMSSFFQAQKQELQNIATKLITDIMKIQQQKSRLQTSCYIEQIKQLIKKPPQQGVNGWQKKVRSKGQFQGSSSKVRNRSNSSKRSSLSQIRNKNEAFFQQGTMLHLMAKRKSVLI